MPKAKGGGRKSRGGGEGADGKRRAGLPPPESIVETRTLVSPKGARFRVIRTTEKDPYDGGGRNGGKR